MKKARLLIITALMLILMSAFALAVFVFMSGDQTIDDGDTATFTCVVDPLVNSADYDIRLSGNGVNRLLASGTVTSSSESIDVNVGPGQYNGAGEYTVTCSADENGCSESCPQCCSSDSASSSLTVNAVENCPPDGCYEYGDGCEDRDYPPSGNCDNYVVLKRRTDSYEPFVNYCMGDQIRRNRILNDFFCDGNCRNHQSTVDDQLVENCNNRDGWADSGMTRNVQVGPCQTRLEKEQKYRDFTCESAACVFDVTDTRWVVVSTSNSPDGTVCAAESGDCEANDVCVAGTCQERYAPSTQLCRAAGGVCDVAEYCTGTSGTCPGDAKKPTSTVCRPAAGACDMYEVCTGTSNDCPGDIFFPAGVECRIANDAQCGITEVCTGNSAQCPPDQNRPDGTACEDGLFCTLNECRGGSCATTAPKDCSANSFPPIDRCDNIPDAIPYTRDRSPGFTSTCDESNDRCTTGERTFTHVCDRERCNAQCTSNSDCEDYNPNTADICLGNCTCIHRPLGQCGDGTVQPPEECELPNTNNNPYCGQTTSGCKGNMTGTRDAFGNCNGACGCAPDAFSLSCVKGSCGATCDSNDDCDNQCIGNIRVFGATCDTQSSCGCVGGQTENCDSKDGWYSTNETRWYSSSGCKEKKQIKKEYRDFVCAPQACQFTVTNTTWIDTNESRNKPDGTTCNDGKFCTVGDTCTAGVCGGPSRDCSNNSYGPIATCNNNPDNKPYTWDTSPGFTSVCDETLDVCTSRARTFNFTCSVANCGAQCEIDSQCDDHNSSTIDKCSKDSCACTHTPSGQCGNGRLDAGEECEISGNYTGFGLPGYQFTCEEDNTYRRCTSMCVYEHVNTCKYYCSASFNCEGKAPNQPLNTCGFGQKFQGDKCDQNCHLADDACEDDFPGCTADHECDGLFPNQGACTYQCEFKPLNVTTCGNGQVDPGEVCDGDSASCTASNGYPGTKACNANCNGYGECIALPYCGDGTCNAGEACSTCPGDCGTCSSGGGGGGGGGSRHRGGGGGGGSLGTYFAQNSTCTDWGICVNGKSTRTCTRGSVSRIETQNCTVTPRQNITFTPTKADEEEPLEKTVVTSTTSTQSTAAVDDSVAKESAQATQIVSSPTGFAVNRPGSMPKMNGAWLFLAGGAVLVFAGGYLVFLKKS